MTATSETPHVEDAKARETAIAVLAGMISEEDARWRIGQIVRHSDVPQAAANRFIGNAEFRSLNSRQQAVDLGDALSVLLFNKVFGLTTDGKRVASRFDLTKLAEGSSLRGWMRNFAATAALSEYRNIVEAQRHEATFGVSLTADYDEDESNPYARAAAHALALSPEDDVQSNSADDVTDRLRTDMIAEGFEQDARKARLVRRTHLAAHAACATFALPTPRRMRSSAERQALGRAINGDPGLPARVITELAEGRAVGSTGDLVVEAFGDYTTRELAKLAEVDSIVLNALALSLATPTLMPPKDRCKALCEAAVIGIPRAQRSDAIKLVNLWLTAKTEADGSEYGAAPKIEDKDDTHLAADRRAYAVAARDFAAKCTVLGGSPAAINSTFAAMLARLGTAEAAALGTVQPGTAPALPNTQPTDDARSARTARSTSTSSPMAMVAMAS